MDPNGDGQDSGAAPARRPSFAEDARAVCLQGADLLRRLTDGTVDRGVRAAARTELGNLLHALKGAAVLEGEVKAADAAARLVELCRAGAETDPLGVELQRGIEPLFRAFGVTPTAGTPSPASFALPVSAVPAAPAGARVAERAVNLPPELKGRLSRLRVLFVDDQLPIRKVAEKFLGELGVRFRLAVDGVDALAQLEREPCDLVFTDLEMPRMNGYELMHEMRSREALRDVPTIVVTGRQGAQHQFAGQTAGAVAWMLKPFTRAGLLEMLEAHGRFGL